MCEEQLSLSKPCCSNRRSCSHTARARGQPGSAQRGPRPPHRRQQLEPGLVAWRGARHRSVRCRGGRSGRTRDGEIHLPCENTARHVDPLGRSSTGSARQRGARPALESLLARVGQHRAAAAAQRTGSPAPTQQQHLHHLSGAAGSAAAAAATPTPAAQQQQRKQQRQAPTRRPPQRRRRRAAALCAAAPPAQASRGCSLQRPQRWLRRCEPKP